MTTNQIHAVGQCDKCEAQVVIPIPDALVALLARAGASQDRAAELADRLQVVALGLHKLQKDLLKGDIFKVSDAGRILGLIETATTPSREVT